MAKIGFQIQKPNQAAPIEKMASSTSRSDQSFVYILMLLVSFLSSSAVLGIIFKKLFM